MVSTSVVEMVWFPRDGLVSLPLLTHPSPPLKDLLEGNNDNLALYFKMSIRAYNSMLSFRSMGAKVDYILLRGGGNPYNFRTHGQNHHLIVCLLSGE